MSVTTKKWVLNTVQKLSTSELEELKHYLEYLIQKSQSPTRSLGNLQDSPKSERKCQPRQILEAISKSNDMTMEDAEALLYSIG